MTRWNLFTGHGASDPAVASPAWAALPEPPPWRRPLGRRSTPPAFEATPELLDAINAALHLRRPLLLTGLPGSGKSTVVDLIAAELDLGPVLRWHVTSKTVLNDGLFHYDALGRLHAVEARSADERTGAQDFVTLGPLGTALASQQPRAVLIDEVDKSDLDLPGDLLNVIEEGSFEIPQLLREVGGQEVDVRGADGGSYTLRGGSIDAEHRPVIVMTSNGERAFPPPFLRRCIRYNMIVPDGRMLARIVGRHLGESVVAKERELIETFATRLREGDTLAVDQVLNVLYLVTGEAAPGTEARRRVEKMLLQSLAG